MSIVSMLRGGNTSASDVTAPLHPFTLRLSHMAMLNAPRIADATEAYQGCSSIQSSAAERTPVELWRIILLIAVESPLLPRNGDDILDGVLLFSQGCMSLIRHQNIETLRCRLRLVCQVWNAILKDEGAHVSFLSNHRLHRVPFHCDGNRKIRRIEMAPYCIIFGENCGPRCVFPGDLPKLLQSTFEDFQWIEHLQLSDNCRHEFPTGLITDVLDKASRLRALALKIPYGPYGIVESLSDVLNHPTLTQITHLSIGPLGVYGEQRLGPTSFPAIRYLAIQIWDNPPQDHVLDWKFPSLSSFHVQRRSTSREKHLFRGLQRFLTSHGKQITSLNIEYSGLGDGIGSLANPIDETFWSRFPNLRLFGPGSFVLDDNFVPPPPEVQLESLAVQGFQARIFQDDPFRLDPYTDRLLLACGKLRVKKLIMLASWEDMGSRFAGISFGRMQLSSSAWPERLFHGAVAEGIDFFDINRVPITDPEGKLFLYRLRNPPGCE
jgi:hypothetical protein